jgi:hypothetical protein
MIGGSIDDEACSRRHPCALFRCPPHVAQREVCRNRSKARLLLQRFAREVEGIGDRVEVTWTMNGLLMIEEEDHIFINIDRVARPQPSRYRNIRSFRSAWRAACSTSS